MITESLCVVLLLGLANGLAISNENDSGERTYHLPDLTEDGPRHTFSSSLEDKEEKEIQPRAKRTTGYSIVWNNHLGNDFSVESTSDVDYDVVPENDESFTNLALDMIIKDDKTEEMNNDVKEEKDEDSLPEVKDVETSDVTEFNDRISAGDLLYRVLFGLHNLEIRDHNTYKDLPFEDTENKGEERLLGMDETTASTEEITNNNSQSSEIELHLIQSENNESNADSEESYKSPIQKTDDEYPYIMHNQKANDKHVDRMDALSQYLTNHRDPYWDLLSAYQNYRYAQLSPYFYNRPITQTPSDITILAGDYKIQVSVAGSTRPLPPPLPYQLHNPMQSLGTNNQYLKYL